MIAKRYGKEIADEFKQKVITRAYRGALEKEKLPVLNIVNVEEGKIEPGLAAAITVIVDVQPEFALPDYTGLPATTESTEATQAEVDQVIEGLRAERADFKAAARPAQKGDFVKLAYDRLDRRPADLRTRSQPAALWQGAADLGGGRRRAGRPPSRPGQAARRRAGGRQEER